MSDSKRIGGRQWTRRGFLEAVGKAGGAAAVYETMVAMGLVRVPDLFAGPPQLPATHGTGKSVVILGAGIAGLTAAYELHKAGYTVTILEANDRAGGRSYTVRRGDAIVETTGTKQICKFDEGPQMYVNAGPGRLPYHHTAILHYCHKLGVPLEVYTMMSRANFYQRDESWKAQAMVNRRIANDTRGFIAELLAKAVKSNTLDAELAGVNKDGLLALLSSFGDVDEKDGYKYLGSSRSGYAVEPGIDSCGVLLEPLRLSDLVDSKFWDYRFYQAEEYEWQPTLFQPVHGMDQIWKAFLRQPLGTIIKDRTVVKIENLPNNKVRVTHRRTGPHTAVESITADWCISSIPMPILATIDTNFSDEFKKTVKDVHFADTCKVGWQTESRFWETRDQMYGGISYTTDPITQMWYPSYDYFGKKGILTGAYNYDDDAREYAKMLPHERLVAAMKGAKKLHPDFDRHVKLDLGVSIAWKQVPHQLGGWADDWTCDVPIPPALLRAEGRFWVVGDQVSYLSGWQEGAVRSALHAIEGITGVRASTPLLKTTVGTSSRKPDVKRRTRGLP